MLSLKNTAGKIAVAVGSLGALIMGAAAHAAVDTDIIGANTPIQNFIDYGKENLLAVIGAVLLGVGAIFVVSLGVKVAFRWLHRAAK
jgi:hypothetical protein